MSTIVLTLNNQTVGGFPITYGAITVVINYGSGNVSMPLNINVQGGGTGKFHWRGVPDNGIGNSTINYAAAFNRDYKNVGGTNNLTATVTANNKVTITAVVGNFISATENSDIASLTSVINNVAAPEEVVFTANLVTATGNCDTIQYSFTATGGTPNFTLKKNGITLSSSWNGSSTQYALTRGVMDSFSVTDSLGVTKSLTVIVPRKLIAAEFIVEQIYTGSSTDIIITESNPVANTGAIQYSLNGVDYQTDNSFTGLFAGTYTLYIKDVYGCVVEKTLLIAEITDNLSTNARIFIISQFNSFSLSRSQNFDFQTKKNVYNTNSYNELVKGQRYTNTTKFLSGQFRTFQFKSSYPYHIITMHRCDGTKLDMPFEKIQQNIGKPEKVDCKLFQESNGKIGVYFDGGNEYEPYTITVINASPYTKGLPKWGNDVDRYITISGVGYKQIKEIKYSEDLSRFYFTVDGTTSQTEATVQVTYNVQDYDTYEFVVSSLAIKDLSILTIEYGFSYDEIVDTYVSEPIEIIEDDEDLIVLEWSSTKNMGEMVFQSGIIGQMVVEGYWRRYGKGVAEVAESQDRTYALNLEAREGIRLTLENLTPNEWARINRATTVSQSGYGKFTINNMEVVRTSEITQTEATPSNLSKVVIDFDFAGESNAVQNDEIVLNISTGVVGGGGNGVISVDDLFQWDGKYRLSSGGEMLTVDGMFITFD